MRIVIADDHQMFRSSLIAVLESQGFEVVGQASDGKEAVELIDQWDPEVAVLDMNMPRLNGIQVQQRLSDQESSCKTVILTMFEDEVSVINAFRAGVHGYVLKSQAATDLVRALHELERGYLYLSPQVAEFLVENYRRSESGRHDSQLTARERQILQLVAEGNATKSIARILNLTVKTVESHRNTLMKKLAANNVAGLVKHAVRQGIILP